MLECRWNSVVVDFCRASHVLIKARDRSHCIFSFMLQGQRLTWRQCGPTLFLMCKLWFCWTGAHIIPSEFIVSLKEKSEHKNIGCQVSGGTQRIRQTCEDVIWWQSSMGISEAAGWRVWALKSVLNSRLGSITLLIWQPWASHRPPLTWCSCLCKKIITSLRLLK